MVVARTSQIRLEMGCRVFGVYRAIKCDRFDGVYARRTVRGDGGGPAGKTISMIAATTVTTVEPFVQRLERLKLVSIYNDDIVKACGVDSAKDLANSVKVNLIKKTICCRSATVPNLRHWQMPV